MLGMDAQQDRPGLRGTAAAKEQIAQPRCNIRNLWQTEGRELP